MPERTTSRRTAAPDVDGTATEVAVVPAPDTPASIYAALDRADMELVEAEIAGAMIETMVYEYQQDGKTVRGLSVVGIRNAALEFAARGLGKITLPDPPIIRQALSPEGEAQYECEIRAVDPINGHESWGAGEAPIWAPRRNGGTYYDKFARRKALSIAQRNAKRDLLPEALIQTMIAQAAMHQVRKVETFRQLAVGTADKRQQERTQQTRAKPPARGQATVTVTASQQRMLMGKAKAAGLGTSEAGGDKDPRLRAIWAWVGGDSHLDRVHKSKVDAVLEAYNDVDGTISAIYDARNEGDELAVKIIDHLLEPAKPGEGQGQLAVNS